jgi:two-component system chemotaxis sensor kinase CheA
MARDPYRYFRIEAKELVDGLVAGVLELEAAGVDVADVAARLMRLTHTLKGAARVVKQPAIAEVAHALEGRLGLLRDAGRQVEPAEASSLLAMLDRVQEGLAALARPDAAAVAGSETPSASTPVEPARDGEPLEVIRVEVAELDALLRGLTETSTQLAALRREVAAAGDEVRADGRFVRGLDADLERVGGGLDALRDIAHRLRLVPAGAVFPMLARAVRDAAEALDRPCRLDARGGEVRLDANVLVELRDALTHIVRNAVAHGIEPAAERRAAGKPATGVIEVAVTRVGDRVVFACRDDGRGIDLPAVRRAASERGGLEPAEAAALPDERVLALLGGGGLSTAAGVSQLAGRGVGLEVARSTAARLRGRLRLASEAGRGAAVELEVPVSLSAAAALQVEAGGERFAVPLVAVVRSIRVGEDAIGRAVDHDVVVDRDEALPFAPLVELLGRRAAAARRAWTVVIVEAGGRRAALGVDRLAGAGAVVVRALPSLLACDPLVAGAALDADGEPQLVLDPAAVVAAIGRARGVARAAPPPLPPILVVDDSLTTRMLERSILESAGYPVDLAVSAEDGLIKARARRYGVFVVDVEMPGMDGFGFVATARDDPALRGVPAILVTSRDGAEDRRRAAAAGARAYIVKGEFDQGQLLATIERLVAVP